MSNIISYSVQFVAKENDFLNVESWKRRKLEIKFHVNSKRSMFKLHAIPCFELHSCRILYNFIASLSPAFLCFFAVIRQ
jgi:hypothetical protein